MTPCIIAGKGEAAIICAICRMRSGCAAIAAICSCQSSVSRRARSSTEGSVDELGPGFLASSAMAETITAFPHCERRGFRIAASALPNGGPNLLCCVASRELVKGYEDHGRQRKQKTGRRRRRQERAVAGQN